MYFRNKEKSLLSFLLVLVLLFSSFSMAFAEEQTAEYSSESIPEALTEDVVEASAAETSEDSSEISFDSDITDPVDTEISVENEDLSEESADESTEIQSTAEIEEKIEEEVEDQIEGEITETVAEAENAEPESVTDSETEPEVETTEAETDSEVKTEADSGVNSAAEPEAEQQDVVESTLESTAVTIEEEPAEAETSATETAVTAAEAVESSDTEAAASSESEEDSEDSEDTEDDSSEEDIFEGPESSCSVVTVNPLYEGIVSEECYRSAAAVTAEMPLFCTAVQYNKETYYTEPKEVVDLVLADVANKASSRSGLRMKISYNSTEGKDALLSFSTALMKDLIPLMAADSSITDDIFFRFGGWSCTSTYYGPETVSDGTYIFYMTITLTYSWYSSDEQETALDAEIDRLFNDGDIVISSDQFETILSIYSYLTSTVTYDYTNLNDKTYFLKFTAYAALVKHTAICQGIATAFYLLAREAGISARVVPSAAMNHAFSLVELDGRWYYLDATWDLGKSEYVYFMHGTANWEPAHDLGDLFNSNKIYYDPQAVVYNRAVYDFCPYTVTGVNKSIYLNDMEFTSSEAGYVYLGGVLSAPPEFGVGYSSAANEQGEAYPTGMRVYRFSSCSSKQPWRANEIDALENVLEYTGASIRCSGNKGLKIVYGIDKETKAQMQAGTLSGMEGYVLQEYGTAACWTDSGLIPVPGTAGTMSAYAYNRDAGYDDDEEMQLYISENGTDNSDSWLFSNALTFTNMERCVPYLTIRPYMILVNENTGDLVTLYGGTVSRSIASVAKQNANIYEEGSEEYLFIKQIIDYVT